MNTQTITLEFKWSISHSRKSDGWNICSLWIHGKKVAHCVGGGYDMKGTALGNWLTEAYQDRLLKIAHRAYDYLSDTGRSQRIGGLYGMTAHLFGGDPQYVSLDGGCGWSSMERIANAIGITLQFIHESSRSSIYTATFVEATA